MSIINSNSTAMTAVQAVVAVACAAAAEGCVGAEDTMASEGWDD